MSRPLYLLPGLGADHRLFEPQVKALDDVHVIPWIEPESADESLAEYARRLVSTSSFQRPFDLGGSSFGGIVALELARHLQPEQVILIGSCRSPKKLPPYYKVLQRVSKLLPDQLLLPPEILSSFIARRFGLAARGENREFFFDMLHHTPVSFIRWASSAVFGWAGSADLRISVHHIHGSDDQIIPVRYVKPDRVVAGAGHLLNLTHRDQVNRFIHDLR
jgi:pimeloyl-ACP methyl ester carboxylesterase